MTPTAVRKWLLVRALIVALLVPSAARSANTPIEMWVPDGQLKSNPIRVYVGNTVTLDMQPRLTLLGSHALTAHQPDEEKKIAPLLVAPNQTWQQPVDGGNRVLRSGSLLLFDLTGFPIPSFKAMMRLTPVLEWTDGGTLQIAVATRAVNIGNPVTAWLMSAGMVALSLLIILLVLGRRVGGLLLEDGTHLSLSRLQIALWTLAVGAIVFGHGLVQLDVPNIPESIVALLGLSLATGGISYLGPAAPSAAANPGAAPAAGNTPPTSTSWSLADLVSDGGLPSISRAQMLFWTVLMIVLFVAKSVLNGVVWEVPWAMVALMGISQGSYLAPKFVPAK